MNPQELEARLEAERFARIQGHLDIILETQARILAHLEATDRPAMFQALQSAASEQTQVRLRELGDAVKRGLNQ